MRAVTIIESKIGSNDSLEIVWSDGVAFYFRKANVDQRPTIVSREALALLNMSEQEKNRRICVSRTSAEATLSGCEFKS